MFGKRKKIKELEAKIGELEQKSAVTTIDLVNGSFLEFSFSGQSRVSPRQAMQFYRNNSAVATAVDLIADAFEQITPILEVNGEFEDNHPVLDLLKAPNGFDTGQEFAGKISRYYLLTHNSHVSALGNMRSAPIEIWSNDPQWVTVNEANDRYPAAYLVSEGPTRGNYKRESVQRNIRFFDGSLKELFHIMGFSSRSSQIWGDSPLEAAAAETKQIIEGKNHNLQVLRNGGRLSLLVQFKDTVDDDEHKARKQAIQEQLGGSDNAGKIGVVSSEDMDVKEFGQNNKDMDYATLEEVAARAIYMRYRIPLPLVSTDASTFNNMEKAIGLLYDWAVLPLADTLFAGLSRLMLPRYGLDLKTTRITYDPQSIETLKKRKLDEIEQRKKFNIETTNELRSMLPDRDDVDGGDVIYQPATMIPIGSDPFGDGED